VTGRIPDLSAINIDEAFQTHANTEDRHASCEVADCIAGYAGVGVGVTGARGDDEGTNLEEGKGIDIDGIISDHVHVCTEKTEVLIEVPSKRIKVIYHKHVQRTSESFGK
jgi:hypothetical protein